MANLADLDAIIDANADYMESRDLTKARAFASALRRKLAQVPQSGAQGISQTTLPIAMWQDMLAKAESWIETNGGAGTAAAVNPGVKHLSFEGFRS